MSFGDMQIENNSKFLKIEGGQFADIHILSKEPVVEKIHGFGEDKEPCAGTHCQFCDEGEVPKQRWKVNVFDRKDSKVKVFEFGAPIARQIKNIAEMLEEQQQSIHEIDLRIKAEGEGLKKTYTVMQKGFGGPIPEGLKLHRL